MKFAQNTRQHRYTKLGKKPEIVILSGALKTIIKLS